MSNKQESCAVKRKPCDATLSTSPLFHLEFHDDSHGADQCF